MSLVLQYLSSLSFRFKVFEQNFNSQSKVNRGACTVTMASSDIQSSQDRNSTLCTALRSEILHLPFDDGVSASIALLLQQQLHYGSATLVYVPSSTRSQCFVLKISGARNEVSKSLYCSEIDQFIKQNTKCFLRISVCNESQCFVF